MTFQAMREQVHMADALWQCCCNKGTTLSCIGSCQETTGVEEYLGQHCMQRRGWLPRLWRQPWASLLVPAQQHAACDQLPLPSPALYSQQSLHPKAHKFCMCACQNTSFAVVTWSLRAVSIQTRSGPEWHCMTSFIQTQHSQNSLN